MAEIRLRLLGRFQVRRDGEEIPPASFGGRKVRTLLRVLAVRAPDLVPHEVLAEALWPDRLPADPAGNLGVLVNRARRAAGEPGLIVTGTGGYALGGCPVDVAEFWAALVAARAATDPAAGLAAASRALALWGEPLVEDTYAPWAHEPRERLLRAHVDALEIAARCQLALGHAPAAAALAADAVAAEPLRESATLELARALAAAGDQAAALARLAELRRRLADELGVDPSPAARELQLALLRGELTTAAPTTAAPTTAAPRTTPPAPPRPRAGFTRLAFVGRDAELARVRAALAAGELAIVSGVPGVGKSRLLSEAVRGSPEPVIAARAFLAERTEAWSLARSVLREACGVDAAAVDALPRRVRDALTGLLPELDEGAADAATPLDGESRRALVLAGGLRLLESATGAGAVLVVDDLQWADPTSLTLLGSALARLPALTGLLAYRTGELDPAVLAGLREARPWTEISLGPLSAAEVARLTGEPALGAALVEHTDGTPFAIGEVLRELADRTVVVAGPSGWTPADGDLAHAVHLVAELGRAGQRRAVRRRALRQTGPRCEALAVLALLARETPARTVASACELPPRAALEVLSALAADGLVRLGEQGWACAHDVVAETVSAALSPGDRGRLHALLAAALEAEVASGDADPSEIARHHREAGDAVAAAAAYHRAARRALAGHATREAGELADAGLALRPHGPVRARLLDVRAEVRAAHGDLTGAEADLRAALSEPDEGRPTRLARLAMLTSGAHDPRRAADLAELALVEAGTDDAQRAVALETAAILDMNLGHPDRARDRAERALILYRKLSDAGGVARILDGRAMATFLDGRIAAGVELFERVARLFEGAGELLRVVTPRSTAGHGLVFLARPAEGLVATGEALRLARELAAPEGQAYALWHRSEALSGLNRGAEAEADAREALAIASGVGHRGWTATAYRALGIALQMQGRLDDAAAAFNRSAELAGDTLTLFASWAAARQGLVAVALRKLDEADAAVRRALTLGPPLGHYEARLAQVELAAARGRPDLPELASAALAAARAGGHLVSVPRLAELSASRAVGSRPHRRGESDAPARAASAGAGWPVRPPG